MHPLASLFFTAVACACVWIAARRIPISNAPLEAPRLAGPAKIVVHALVAVAAHPENADLLVLYLDDGSGGRTACGIDMAHAVHISRKCMSLAANAPSIRAQATREKGDAA